MKDKPGNSSHLVIYKTVSLLVAAALLVIGFVAICVIHGRGARTELSLDTFQRRTYHEVLIPALDVPIYQSNYEYEEFENPLIEYLVSKGYWKAQSETGDHWIVHVHWNNQWKDGYGRFYRDLRNHEDWIEWTEANPEMAEVMWPYVLTLLREDNPGATHVMFLARQAKSLDELRTRVNEDPELRELGVRWPD